MQIDLSALFGLPPEEAIKAFEAKGYKLSWDWHDTWREQNARAFTVAKLMRMDVLQDINGALRKSLADGQTEAWFVRRLAPVLQDKGWWGKKIVVGADGQAEVVQEGSPRRLRTIFRANLQTAYAAARWKQFQANAADRPYLQYVAVLDDRSRPAHAALNGKVFHINDPVWRVIAPPNGFNCRCRVRALSQKNLSERGLRAEPAAEIVERQAGQMLADKRTGEFDPAKQKQRGVSIPDPSNPGRRITLWADSGWDYNPGEAWAQWDKNGRITDCDGLLDFAEGDRCIPLLPQKSYKDFSRPDLRDVPASLRLAAPQLLERAATRAQAVERMADAIGVSMAHPLRVVDTPIEQVAVRHEFLTHLIEKEADARERYANYILPTLQTPFEIWLSEYQDGYRRRYIGLFDRAPNLLVVVRVNKDGSLMWNIMHAVDKKLNKQREGALLYGK